MEMAVVQTSLYYFDGAPPGHAQFSNLLAGSALNDRYFGGAGRSFFSTCAVLFFFHVPLLKFLIN